MKLTEDLGEPQTCVSCVAHALPHDMYMMLAPGAAREIALAIALEFALVIDFAQVNHLFQWIQNCLSSH